MYLQLYYWEGLNNGEVRRPLTKYLTKTISIAEKKRKHVFRYTNQFRRFATPELYIGRRGNVCIFIVLLGTMEYM